MFINTSVNVTKYKGVTLIELMLSLTMTLFILGIMITIYSTAKHNVQIQTELSAIQENARMAVRLLESDLRMAGYIGCPKLTKDFPLTYFFPYDLTPDNKIMVDHDTVTVRHASIPHAHLMKKMVGFSTLYVSQKPHFVSDAILLISDCSSAQIFQVKQAVKFGGDAKNSNKTTLNKAI